MNSESDKGGFVGRGGLKLEAALGQLGGREAIENAEAIDVGASTGGFTECLLKHGALKVTALEVGHSQLHEKLKSDPRVINLEKTNFKTVSLRVAPGPFDYFVVDVSFVAARTMLRPLAFRLKPGAEGVILVKPQFELSEGYVQDGLVKAEGLRTWALNRVKKKAEALGFKLLGSADSPVELESGTVEILTRWRFMGKTQLLTDPAAAHKAKSHPRPAPTGTRNWKPARPSTPQRPAHGEHTPRTPNEPIHRPARPERQAERPSRPGERPSRPGERPSRPGERPSRPFDRPTRQAERPTAREERRPEREEEETFERPAQPARPPRPTGKIPYDKKRQAAPPVSRAERRAAEFVKPGSRREAMPFEVPQAPPRPRDDKRDGGGGGGWNKNDKKGGAWKTKKKRPGQGTVRKPRKPRV
jgi:23S rRNA (cytidine1920-2'-O)/16S rRNA (cytidine1409-2'-O)-methyltransferase